MDGRARRGGPLFVALCLVAGGLRAAAEAPRMGLDNLFPRLRVGMWVSVEGPRTPEGILQASKIKVYDGELDEVEVESDVAAVDLVRMTVETTVGVRVVATPSTEVEGPQGQRHASLALIEVGDRVKIEGQLQKDGSLLAEEIDIDKPKAPSPALPPGSKHELRARIESIDAAGHRIEVLGLPIQLGEGTRIRSPFPD